MNRITITSHCVRGKSKKATCHTCMDACMSEALSATESGGIHLHVGACNQCGACTVACPVNAIEGNLPVRKTEEHILFEDNKALLTVKELLLYHQNNYQHIVIESKTSQWYPVIKKTNEMLAQLAQPLLTVSFDPGVITEQISKSRRAFLRVDLLNKSHSSADMKIENQLLSHVFADYQFFTVNVDKESCSLCSACLRLCPTLAIKYEQQQFVIKNSRCIGCRACEDGCPEQSLKVQESIQTKGTSRIPFVFNVCHECKQHYLALSNSNTLCTPCKVRKSLNLNASSMLNQNANI